MLMASLKCTIRFSITLQDLILVPLGCELEKFEYKELDHLLKIQIIINIFYGVRDPYC